MNRLRPQSARLSDDLAVSNCGTFLGWFHDSGLAGGEIAVHPMQRLNDRWNWIRFLVIVSVSIIATPLDCPAETIALWLFDEQAGLYPSCVLGDAASGEHPLVIGLGGRIVPGMFGNALEPAEPVEVPSSAKVSYSDSAGGDPFGIRPLKNDQTSITWTNSRFCALMTRGETHLRQEVNFSSPTSSRLNLGDRDWTVEFWFQPTHATDQEGMVLEIGQGPRAKNESVTQLLLSEGARDFMLVNTPSDTQVVIPTNGDLLINKEQRWCHLAFVYDSGNQQLRHYVNGQLQPLPTKCQLKPLPEGEEAYLTVGRDGSWNRPLPGRIDELRISDAQIYRDGFNPPKSFSKYPPHYAAPPLKLGQPLLFAADTGETKPIALGSRKHLFIDDALIDQAEKVDFRVNPPRLAERVWQQRGMTNHLVVFEDVEGGDGLIRFYGNGPQRSLAVWTSRDGVEFEAPDLGREYLGARNVVIEDPVGLGTIFVDPNAPPEERIKYFSGYRGRGHYVYSSPDGYRFVRNETSALPFRGASQSIVYYDEQRQVYVGYHRSDMLRTPGGKSARTSMMTETKDLMRPWPLEPLSPTEQHELAKTMPLGKKIPYFVDNGPLTPPGFGVEYPAVFGPEENLDPVGTDVYVPKCLKYPWAEDTYLAFPIMYFHYHGDGPAERQALGMPEANRGSGPLETQLSVSRDGIDWHRYPRPAYIGIGRHDEYDLKKAYIGHGMVKRGNEIWQYYVGSEFYHSAWPTSEKQGLREAIFRVVQRLDGFVSADTPYTGGELTTKPFTFDGNRLLLNIDTDAAGFAQVGILDGEGKPIDGYSLEECVYINGDFTEAEVEWLDRGSDISHLKGKTVQIVIRSRGTKLYSLQFVTRENAGT